MDKKKQDPLLRITPDDFVPSHPEAPPRHGRVDPLLHVTPSSAPDTLEPGKLLLSVIIPVRNEQDSLPACLQSILTQSEPGFALGEDWELLLVDDASTDQTPAILAAAASRPGISILSPGDPV